MHDVDYTSTLISDVPCSMIYESCIQTIKKMVCVLFVVSFDQDNLTHIIRGYVPDTVPAILQNTPRAHIPVAVFFFFFGGGRGVWKLWYNDKWNTI